jgi:hypothetical protein
MFRKHNGFVSKARVSACMYFLVSFSIKLLVGYHVSCDLIGYATSRLFISDSLLVATSGEGRESQWPVFKY